MPRRVLTVLALISTVTGCAAPPKGPLVEYRDNLTPITRPARYEITCALVRTDQQGPPLVAHRVVKGERVGFRREPDGSVVAVAPGYILPLPPGTYAWEVVEESVPSWREWIAADIRETREWCVSAVRGVGSILVIGTGLALLLALAIAYGIGESNTNRAR